MYGLYITIMCHFIFLVEMKALNFTRLLQKELAHLPGKSASGGISKNKFTMFRT